MSLRNILQKRVPPSGLWILKPRFASRAPPKPCPGVKKWTCYPEPYFLDPDKPQPKLVIIGAGMSGLSAANRLSRCGFTNFVILEAKERPGGRIHTLTSGNGKKFELGASRIEGGSAANPVYTMACVEGLQGKLSPPVSKNTPTYLVNDGRAIEQETASLGSRFFNDIMKDAVALFFLQTKLNKSLKDFLLLQMQKKLNEIPEELRFDVSSIVYSHIQCLNSRWGTDLDNISADQYGSTVEIPGSPLVAPGGMSEILTSLLSDIPQDKIKYCKTVENIDWGGSSAPVQVRCCDGECFAADLCLVTVSLGVLKEFAVKLFSPELPGGKLQAIDRLGFGCVDKIFIQYKTPFWGKGEGSIQLCWTPKEFCRCKHWISGISSFQEGDTSDNNVLATTVAGEEAFEMEKLADGEVAEDLTFLLHHFTGDHEIPCPLKVLRSKWGLDPCFLGSGSFLGVGSSVSDQCALGAPVGEGREPRLLFAGEATTPGFMATMHGARKSGIREAQRILAICRARVGPYPIPQCLSSTSQKHKV